jgi:hypothetical protein
MFYCLYILKHALDLIDVGVPQSPITLNQGQQATNWILVAST